ncbi:MAG: ParA family protein [Phycisphaerales bacterium]|nr:ParA family protein [Phycisphaerales bacterium]
MRAIAVLNQKGGVGKTTTAVNLAAALARDGQRVLLLDLDPQGHATLHVGLELPEDALTVYDVFVRGAAIAETARMVTDRMAIAPAHIDLVGAEVELCDQENREHVLARTLGPYAEHFDYVIIDCAPSLGLLTINALTAAREVIIPLQPHFLALQGLGRLLQTTAGVRAAFASDLRILGVVMCMFERGTKLGQEVVRDVQGFLAAADAADPWYGAVVFETQIRRNIKLAEAPSFGKTIFDYAPVSHGAEDYLALAREIHAARVPADGELTRAARDARELLPPASAPVDPAMRPSSEGIGAAGGATAAAAHEAAGYAGADDARN